MQLFVFFLKLFFFNLTEGGGYAISEEDFKKAEEKDAESKYDFCG